MTVAFNVRPLVYVEWNDESELGNFSRKENCRVLIDYIIVKWMHDME